MLGARVASNFVAKFKAKANLFVDGLAAVREARVVNVKFLTCLEVVACLCAGGSVRFFVLIVAGGLHQANIIPIFALNRTARLVFVIHPGADRMLHAVLR